MGRLIVFEGIEGAGKSFQCHRLYRHLIKENIPCLIVHEPGGTPLGERVRRLLKSYHMAPETELFLFSATRAELVSQVILPAMKENKIVLIDRFFPSTLAYQAYGRGISPQEIHKINLISTKGIVPDLIILLDLPVEEGLRRKRLNPKDRFEAENLDFHHRVREGYLKLAQQDPRRWLVIDALLPADKITSLIWEKVSGLISDAAA